MAREEPVTTGPGEAPTTPPSPARPGRPGGLGRRAIRIARRAQIRSPVLQGLTALAIYLAVWLTYAPVNALLAHPTVPRLSLESGDPGFFAWTLRWWPYAISHHINPLYTTQIRVPGGFGLTWITSIPALGVLAAPLTETMGPVASFNLLTVLALPLTAWAAFVLCRRLTRRFWPSLVGGAVFGFSAYEMVHSADGDLDLTYSLLLPIIGYLVLLWWDGAIGDGRFVTLTGLALAAQFYLFLETFADMTALLAAALIVGFVLAGRSFRGQVARLAGLLGIAYALALALGAPYLYAALTNVPANFVVHGRALDLASLRTDIPLFVAAVALAVLKWRSKITWFLMVMLAIAIASALGPTLTISGHRHASLPWGWVWSLPFLRTAFPGKLILFVYLILAVMTAIFLAGPAPKTWHLWARLLLEARWLLAGVIVWGMVINTPSFIPGRPAPVPYAGVPGFISSGQYRHVLSPGETVAVISDVHDAGMLWQADTNFYFRLVGGYVSINYAQDGDLPAQIQALADNKPVNVARHVRTFEDFVVYARVGAILIDQKYKPRWAGIFRDIGLRGHVVGGVLIYPTDGCRACRVPVHRHRDAGRDVRTLT